MKFYKSKLIFFKMYTLLFVVILGLASERLINRASTEAEWDHADTYGLYVFGNGVLFIMILFIIGKIIHFFLIEPAIIRVDLEKNKILYGESQIYINKVSTITIKHSSFLNSARISFDKEFEKITSFEPYFVAEDFKLFRLKLLSFTEKNNVQLIEDQFNRN